MPIGVLPVARPRTARPPSRRRSLIISAIRFAMVRAISSYSTMTTGTRSFELAMYPKIYLSRPAFDLRTFGLEHVPDAGVFRAQHPHRETAQTVAADEIELFAEAACIFEKNPLVDAAVGEVGERNARHAIPLHHGAVTFGDPRAPRPTYGLAPGPRTLGNGAILARVPMVAIGWNSQRQLLARHELEEIVDVLAHPWQGGDRPWRSATRVLAVGHERDEVSRLRNPGQTVP